MLVCLAFFFLVTNLGIFSDVCIICRLYSQRLCGGYVEFRPEPVHVVCLYLQLLCHEALSVCYFPLCFRTPVATTQIDCTFILFGHPFPPDISRIPLPLLSIWPESSSPARLSTHFSRVIDRCRDLRHREYIDRCNGSYWIGPLSGAPSLPGTNNGGAPLELIMAGTAQDSNVT